MALPAKISILTMEILEYLAQQETPKTMHEIRAAMKPEAREKTPYQFSSMVRMEYVKTKPNGVGAMAYELAKNGRELVKNKSKIELVTTTSPHNHGLTHPETGQPISSYQLKKYREARGEIKTRGRPANTEQPQLALPNISGNAMTMMDQVSAVIQENANYRDALLKIGNEIAGMLGMIMMPRDL